MNESPASTCKVHTEEKRQKILKFIGAISSRHHLI